MSNLAIKTKINIERSRRYPPEMVLKATELLRLNKVIVPSFLSTLQGRSGS